MEEKWTTGCRCNLRIQEMKGQWLHQTSPPPPPHTHPFPKKLQFSWEFLQQESEWLAPNLKSLALAICDLGRDDSLVPMTLELLLCSLLLCSCPAVVISKCEILATSGKSVPSLGQLKILSANLNSAHQWVGY